VIAGLAAGLRLAVRGLWFRRSTATIVLVLAVVASAASVIAPLYTHSAEESILRDTVRAANPFSLSVQVVVPNVGGSAAVGPGRNPAFTVGVIKRELREPAFERPQQSYSSRGTYHPTTGPNANGQVVGPVVERADGLCAHLPAVQGRCPRAQGEAMLSRRSMRLLGLHVGDTAPIVLPDAADIDIQGGQPPELRMKVVGAYDPIPVDDAYWVGRPYFDGFAHSIQVGPTSLPPVADPAFLGPGTAVATHITSYVIDVPVDPDRVSLADTGPMRAQIRRLGDKLSGYELDTSSQLPAALAAAHKGRDLIRVAAPLAVTQLVLLAWWTLFLVVGTATEERSPEIGLAKLRGLGAGQTGRFGLAEIVLLLVIAGPLGTVLGWLALRAAAPRVFARGTPVVLTGSVLLTVSGALAGGLVTALLAARGVLRRPVTDLLRRVPPRRRGRKAGLVEGVVLALSLAGIAQLLNDRGGRPSPVALLAPGMVAVAGGLVAGRLLVRVARRRSEQALERGRPASVVGWSGVARRPGTARIASVLAVATCLLLVGVEAWAVAERNRHERAAAETGAAVVLDVNATDLRALERVVDQADPSGGYAMTTAYVQSADERPPVLAVQADRADRVMTWGRPGIRPHGGVRRILRPQLPPPLPLAPGRLSAQVDTARLRSPSPVLLLALAASLDGRQHEVPLGRLRTGLHTYTGTVTASCAPGCRLVGFATRHAGTDLRDATMRFTLRRISAGSPGQLREIPGGFIDGRNWRPPAPILGGPTISLQPGRFLHVRIQTAGGIDAELDHADVPEPLPALGGAHANVPPHEVGAPPIAEAVGMSGTPGRYLVDRRVRYLPRVGDGSVMVDLDLALMLSPDTPAGDRQVWLARDDHAAEVDLVQRLKARGIAVTGRHTEAALERDYAGDGAVLALRLLLVCGGAAVVVSVGALLVAAYVGRRQRAYEVAALRAVGVRRSTVARFLVRENLGTVLVALLSGAVAALLATWAVLPALPQFDTPSEMVLARFTPETGTGALTVVSLGAVLTAVAVVVAVLQLRAGRPERLREGVR
jgi:ABC-type lipoprotein release transport system permease subunit